MIERHITFNVHPDRTGEFERFFADDYGPAMATSPGFVKAELLREAESETRYQMVLRFEDADSAAGWRTSAVHGALQPALRALYAENEIQAYEVVG
jgi:antibiotic biosynthesis monooxygenase (ABM) superfamily enzyme